MIAAVGTVPDVDPHTSVIIPRPDPLPDKPPWFSSTKSLYDYQRAGVTWLRTLDSCGIGGVLAHEMGLGKTAQTVALLQWLAADGRRSPHLVVVPKATRMAPLHERPAVYP